MPSSRSTRQTSRSSAPIACGSSTQTWLRPSASNSAASGRRSTPAAAPAGAAEAALADGVEVYEVTGAGLARTRLQAATRRGLTRFVGRDVDAFDDGSTVDADNYSGRGQRQGSGAHELPPNR